MLRVLVLAISASGSELLLFVLRFDKSVHRSELEYYTLVTRVPGLNWNSCGDREHIKQEVNTEYSAL
jgi:hypothetical protein